MASTKAWYWLGLGVLALSFISSGTGRSAMDHATSLVSCVRTRTLPYLGAIEMALGRTQAGFDHLQAAADQRRALLDARRARIEAAQAMLQDERLQEQLKRAQQVLNERVRMGANVSGEAMVDMSGFAPPMLEVMNGAEHVVICPRTRVRVATPAVHVMAPAVNVHLETAGEPI